MFLFRKIVNRRCFIFVIDTTFSTKSLDICYLVDTESVSFVDWCAMYMFCCVNCLLRRLVLNESIAIRSAESNYAKDR